MKKSVRGSDLQSTQWIKASFASDSTANLVWDANRAADLWLLAQFYSSRHGDRSGQ